MFNRNLFWGILALTGAIALAFGLLHDFFQLDSASYGKLDKVVIWEGCIVLGIGLACYSMNRFDAYGRFRVLAKRAYIFEYLVVILGIIGMVVVGYPLWESRFSISPPGGVWSIGIYVSKGELPLEFTGKGVKNPVIVAADVTDAHAEFVADPFIIEQNSFFYMFFEMFNAETQKGEIAYAKSHNGFEWSYKGVVINESFHMSYPYVFKWQGEIYLIPQSNTNSVRLYKADPFPDRWVHVTTLLTGAPYVDSTIFQFNDDWWLLTHTGEDSSLRLYFSDSPLGKWIEHPASPVVKGDDNIARPGGRVVVFNSRVVRYAQDCVPYYGNQVWAIEITHLNRGEYHEKILGDIPILKGYDNWNTRGMHTLSPIPFQGGWIAVVDGY